MTKDKFCPVSPQQKHYFDLSMIAEQRKYLSMEEYCARFVTDPEAGEIEAIEFVTSGRQVILEKCKYTNNL